MLRLTTLLRCKATSQDGRSAGRIDDVVADTATAPPVVAGLSVAGKRRTLLDADRLAVSDAAPAGDLLLRRDVLDVQVLDQAGRHRGRVGEVELEPDAEGRLTVVAVETGLRPVLRRLRLGRIAERAPCDRIEWDQLHSQVGRAHAFSADLADRPRRFRGVMHARRRAPR